MTNAVLRVKSCISGMCLLTCMAAGARTVALWTWNQDVERGSITGRSSVSQHALEIKGDGLSVVDHPDATGVYANLDVPDGLNARDFANDGKGAHVRNGYATCSTLNPVLELTRSWTIEGWFSMNWLPGNGNWLPIFHTRANAGGWLFTVRQHAAGVFNYELFADGGAVNDGTYFLGNLSAESVTNGWKHLALVYDHDATGVPGKGVWTFYIDGVQAGVSITNQIAMTKSINTTAFQIMGRNEHTNDYLMDYVRVCDEALTPDRFLCAAPVEPAAPVASDGTIGFWRLDQDGSVENLVGDPGTYPLSAGGPHANMSTFRAFETCPNASAGVPANTGGAFLFKLNESLSVANAGTFVDFDKAFTLEGWFFMQEWTTTYSGNPARLLFSTRSSGGYGFHLWYNMGNSSQFTLYARAQDRIVEEGGESTTLVRTQVADRRFPGDPWKLWNTWHHVALTYDPAGATLAGDVSRGVWEVFVDGASFGCLTNELDSAEVSGMTTLYLGGRPAYGAVGHLDTLRLTKRVLAPSEFLCTAGGTSPAATDVEALWPLDLTGFVPDGRDLMGRHPLWTNYASDIGVSADGAVERVPNPPVGVPGGARNDGSVAFPASAVANNYLSVANIHRDLDLSKDFTVEAWFRFNALPSGWSTLFINGTGNQRWCLWIRNMVGKVRYMMLVQHGDSNYTVPDNTRFSNDADLPVPTDGKWHHHALVYRAKQGAAE